MGNSHNESRLRDAIDLIKMLEHLSMGYSSSAAANSDVPWAGIRLTLGKARDLLSELLEGGNQPIQGERSNIATGSMPQVYQAADPHNVAPHTNADSEQVRVRRNTLADRIQPLPSSAPRVRELGREENLSSSAGFYEPPIGH